MRATTGGASASRPRPLTRRQQKIVAVARRSVTARGHEIQQVARAYKRLNLTPAEQRLANRAAEQHGARLRRRGNLHDLAHDTNALVGFATGVNPEHPLRNKLFGSGAANLALGAGMFLPLGRVLRGAKDVGELGRAARVARKVPKMPADMSPEVQASARKIVSALSFGGAKKARVAQDVLNREEAARRAGLAHEALLKTPGVEAFDVAKEHLRGLYPKLAFNAAKDKFSEKEVQDLYNHIKFHKKLGYYEKNNTKEALDKLFAGEVPTNYDRGLLYKTFGPEWVRTMEAARLHHVKHLGLEIANIPRSAMASVDASGGLRQALVAGVRHPKMFAENYPSYFKQIASEDTHQAAMQAIHQHPQYADAVQHGLSLTELGPLDRREEQFMSNLAEKLTGGKYSPIRASGRGYVGFLDKMRMDMYAHHTGEAEKFYGQALTEAQKRGISNFINNATGRGSLGKFENSAVHLNSLFFSPRLLASRLNLLNPRYYQKLDPYSRRQAFRSMAHLVGFVGAILETAHLAGASVTLDPRNPDWGKIRLGNTRIDILGGFQQPIRLAAQELTRTTISSTTGEKTHFSPGVGGTSGLDVAIRFGRSKLAPTPSMLVDYLKGQDFQGNPVTVKNEAASHLVPLGIQDAYSQYQDKGNVPKALGAYGLSATGVGVQTYGPKDRTKKVREANANLTQAFEQHVQQYFHQGLTPQIKRALRLRQERQVWMAQNTDKNSTAVERYNAQVDLMLKKKMITPKQANHAKAWAKTQDPHVLKSRTSSLGSKYFGGTVLNSAAKKIRTRGGTHFYLSNY